MNRWWRATARTPDVEPDTVQASPAYRRYLAAAAWSGGSARDWDHSVRPVLAELVDLADAARRLDPELWALVDPDAPRSPDRSAPGPGRDALLRILRELDRP